MHPHPVSAPAMNSKYQVIATHACLSVLLITLPFLLLMDQAFSSSLISPVSLKIKSFPNINSWNKSGVKLEYEGCIREGSPYISGGYFIYISIGTPAKGYMLLVDTASDLTWVQSSICDPCHRFPSNYYSAADSRSSVDVRMDESSCSLLLDLTIPSDDNICRYKEKYKDGSGTTGSVVRETLAIGGYQLVEHVIGVGLQNSGVSGILGLGRKESSFVSQAQVNNFSHCFVTWGSDEESTMEFNIKLPDAFYTSIQMVPRPLYSGYFVDLREIRVDNERIPIDGYKAKEDVGGTMIDTGSFASGFPSTTYQSFQDAVISYIESASPELTRVQPLIEATELCYDGMPIVPVTLVFEIDNIEKPLIIPHSNIFMEFRPQDRPAIYCLAFRRRNPTDYSMMGNYLLQHFRVYYDLDGQRISFVSGMC